MSDQILLGELVQRQNSINKPGTACLGCRRRKLKCDRANEGCHNCSKSSLQCVYPAPEVGAKRKRGPYKKDKTPRERHLEDLVKYLKPEASKSGQDTGSSDQSSPYDEETPGSNRPKSVPTASQADSESLVTDALIALSGSSVADHKARDDKVPSSVPKYVSSGVHGTAASKHPPIRRIFEYWHIFVTRIDPMVKVVHCPSFAEKLFAMIDNIGSVAPSTNSLLFSIYYTALSSCTAREARQRFGESREDLMQRYSRHFESAVGHSFDVPSLESLQSLVLYMIPNHRHSGGSIKHLFQVAMRSAQMLRLNEDPGSSYSPLEAELRRRLWYHLCGLESKSAEEASSRKASILHDHSVRMPSNLNDWDVAPGISEMPQPRSGITESTFVTLRFELHSLIFGLIQVKKKWAALEPSKVVGRMRDEQMERLDMTQRRIQNDYLQNFDLSRPHDWMCSHFVSSMLIKARLMIEFPGGTVPSKTMPLQERMHLLQSSVEIIQATHLLSTDSRISDALWYFRGYVQWHCIAVVVAELGWNVNQSFSNSAWAVLDPMLSDWDEIYETKRDGPAWDHVNAVIERARALRVQGRAHAGRRHTTGKARTTSSTDMLLNRSGSTGSSTTSSYPIRSTAIDTPSDQSYGSSTESSQHYTGGSWGSLPQQPVQFQHPFVPQYSMSGVQEMDPYAAIAGFDVNSVSGFDDINFSAFNEVFSSQSWNHFDPTEHYIPSPYEPAYQAAGCADPMSR